MAYSTLYDYYNSLGQALPSLSTRAGLYESAGLGSSSTYQGTATQNTSLLNYLQQPKPTTLTGTTAPLGSTQATNDILQQASQITGIPAQTFTEPTLVPNFPGYTIPTSTLQAQTPITPPAPPPATNTADVLAAGATQQSSQTNADITAAKTAESQTQAQYDSLANEISGLLGTTVGRGEAQLSAEAAAGVPGLQQNLADINGQIQTKLAEFNKIQAQYAQATQVQEGKTIPMNLIIGRDAELNRSLALQKNTFASDIGLLQAQASALQGKLDLAKQTADRAVDLKYEDATTLIDVKMKQLSFISDRLTASEKKTADLLAQQYQAQKDQLSIQMANEKDKNATILNLLQANPGAGISLTDTVEQAAAKAAAYQTANPTSSSSPAAIQEYQFAQQQGFTGSYQQWIDRNRTTSGGTSGGASGATNLSITQKADFADDISALSAQTDRASALNLLNQNKTALVVKYGQSNYDLMVKEVDRLFPATTQATTTAPTTQSAPAPTKNLAQFPASTGLLQSTVSSIYNYLFK